MDAYSTIRTIGKGSFGEAVLVRDVASNALFVMKKIKLPQGSERKIALREGKVLSKLCHPNIIRYRDSFVVHANLLCILTEYADGGDLQQRLLRREKAGRRYTESQILNYFVQTCLALKHVHDAHILHRVGFCCIVGREF